MKPTSATEAVIDALAVARLTKLAQDDEVWPVRELREAYLRKAGYTRFADLATCVWCCSFWVALAVVLARHRFPRAWPWIARCLASSAVAGYLAELSG